MNTEKQYTQNWNQEFIKNTKGIGKFDLCLEIGCFEGLTSNYIIDNLLNENGKIICVDPLCDQYIPGNIDEYTSMFTGQFERFRNNTKEHIESGKLIFIHDRFEVAVSSPINIGFWKAVKWNIDFVYIDGDHSPRMVYSDAIYSFALLKPEGVTPGSGGIMLFDDYLWNGKPNPGIDKFLKEYEGQYTMMINDYQVMIQKK